MGWLLWFERRIVPSEPEYCRTSHQSDGSTALPRDLPRIKSARIPDVRGDNPVLNASCPRQHEI
ncbi:MAG TPA: hypothetical protein VN693_02380 [Rhodanobacteraceae bacterium]|nr:hypothetical protein [Rhodanobacteraceae bacterium]